MLLETDSSALRQQTACCFYFLKSILIKKRIPAVKRFLLFTDHFIISSIFLIMKYINQNLSRIIRKLPNRTIHSVSSKYPQLFIHIRIIKVSNNYFNHISTPTNIDLWVYWHTLSWCLLQALVWLFSRRLTTAAHWNCLGTYSLANNRPIKIQYYQTLLVSTLLVLIDRAGPRVTMWKLKLILMKFIFLNKENIRHNL